MCRGNIVIETKHTLKVPLLSFESTDGVLLLQPNWVPQRRHLKVRLYLQQHCYELGIFKCMVGISNVRLSSRLILLHLALIELGQTALN